VAVGASATVVAATTVISARRTAPAMVATTTAAMKTTAASAMKTTAASAMKTTTATASVAATMLGKSRHGQAHEGQRCDSSKKSVLQGGFPHISTSHQNWRFNCPSGRTAFKQDLNSI
jgi:hypothetical protein